MPEGSAQPRASVVVAIVTYQRGDDLAAALPAVLAEVGPSAEVSARVLVVDNDPAGSAAGVVAQFPGVGYVTEPTPGIASARNKALDCVPNDDLLIFIDDDEHPRPGWLDALLSTWRSTSAAAVAGPVVSEYAAVPEPWVTAGRFFDRRRLPSGTPIDVAATNNLLLDLRVVRELDLRFDLAFGLTGGSDTMFTRSLARAGKLMVWCDDAVVVDRVPAARLTRQWVLKRAFRTGNSGSRVSVAICGGAGERLRARLRETLRGLARIVGGAAMMGVGVVLGSLRRRARGRRAISRGAGMVAGANGSFYIEYARPVSAAVGTLVETP